MENNSLNTGKIVKINPEIFEKAANDFSEGNESLKKLLVYCFENDIITSACCSGHNGEKRPYIQFDFNDKNMNSILKILNQISLDDAVNNLTFIKQPGQTSILIVSMENDKYNEGFEQVLEALQSERTVDISELDEKRKEIVNIMQNHSVPNNYFEIQEEIEQISIAVPEQYAYRITPSYKEMKKWTESTLISEYEKDNPDTQEVLEKLALKTRNEKYRMNHPYNKDKVDAFWKDKQINKTIELNQTATIERQYESHESNVIIVEAQLGMSIENVAKEIMYLNQAGQACITNFNSFIIDSREYNSAEEIVQAYMKERNRHKEEQTKQEGENNSFISKIQDGVVVDDLQYRENIKEINGSPKVNINEQSLEE